MKTEITTRPGSGSVLRDAPSTAAEAALTPAGNPAFSNSRSTVERSTLNSPRSTSTTRAREPTPSRTGNGGGMGAAADITAGDAGVDGAGGFVDDDDRCRRMPHGALEQLGSASRRRSSNRRQRSRKAWPQQEHVSAGEANTLDLLPRRFEQHAETHSHPGAPPDGHTPSHAVSPFAGPPRLQIMRRRHGRRARAARTPGRSALGGRANTRSTPSPGDVSEPRRRPGVVAVSGWWSALGMDASSPRSTRSPIARHLHGLAARCKKEYRDPRLRDVTCQPCDNDNRRGVPAWFAGGRVGDVARATTL